MRTDTLFNLDWKFSLSDSCPTEQSAWKSVRLPHDWSVEYPLMENALTGGGGGFAQAGIGWYQKSFLLEDDLINASHIALLFEGAYMDTTVYLNGIELAHHNYGYTPFYVTLDKALLQGENQLLVKVDNSHQPNSRWYSGSGIYRNVHLITYEDVHFSPWGVRCHTNRLYPHLETSDLLIKAQVDNESDQRAIAHILCQISDHEGNVVSTAGTALTIEEFSSNDSEIRPEVKNPHLWTIDDPYLYTLQMTVSVDDTVVDTWTCPIGIRTATFDCDKGFLLNGESVKIKGMCLHHDCGLTGAVGHKEVWRRRLLKLKDMGCNGIRCSHNPPETALLDLCDELGFLVMDEIFDEWKLTKHKNNNYYSQQLAYGSSMFFASEAEENTVAMLRRDFNHPSVILWSIGNEIPEQSSLDGVRIAHDLQEICHKEDASRMVTSACDNIVAGGTVRTLREFENTLDVVGYNYVGRWRERAETFYDEDRHLFPSRRMYGSENPSVGGERGYYGSDSFWGSYATASLHHEPLWRYTISHDFVAGDYLWTGIDYLGECRWPKKGSPCAPIDIAGFEKDSYYYFRSIWNTSDVTLHLLPHWNWSGEEGTFKQVVCYTNCEEVELYINDRLVGRKGLTCPRFGAVNNWFERTGIHATTNDLHLTWDVPYEPGILKAVGYLNGEVVATELVQTVEKPVALQSTCFQKPQHVDDIIQVELEAIDQNQHYVATASDMILCQTQGPVTLIGMDNGDLGDLSLTSLPSRKLNAGKLFAMFRVTGTGPIEINFTSPNLSTTTLTYEINE